MNAIADALGMGKLPSPVLYIVIGLVSDATASVGFVCLLGHFSYRGHTGTSTGFLFVPGARTPLSASTAVLELK